MSNTLPPEDETAVPVHAVLLVEVEAIAFAVDEEPHECFNRPGVFVHEVMTVYQGRTTRFVLDADVFQDEKRRLFQLARVAKAMKGFSNAAR